MTQTAHRYRFPKSLELFDLYLKQKGYDTSRLRSDRHALDVLRTKTGIRVRFPLKGKSCYCSLRRLHNELFPAVPLKKAPAKARRIKGIGSTGPASDCRTVSSEIWASIASKHESGA